MDEERKRTEEGLPIVSRETLQALLETSPQERIDYIAGKILKDNPNLVAYHTRLIIESFSQINEELKDPREAYFRGITDGLYLAYESLRRAELSIRSRSENQGFSQN